MSGTTPPPAARPSLAPSRPEPNAENMHTEPDDDASGDNPSPGTLAARERENHAPPTPQIATRGGPPQPRGTTEGIPHLPQNTLTQPGRSPPNAFQGCPRRLTLRGGPPPTCSYQHLCAAVRGAPHPRTAYPGGIHRPVDLVVQLPAGGWGADMGPAPRLATPARPPADQDPTCTQPRRPDASRASSERRRPQHPTIQELRVLAKQDGQGEGAKPPDDDGAPRANGGTRGTRGASAARHPQHCCHGRLGKRPLVAGEDQATTTEKPLGLGGP